jgi:hypothetical protein
MLALSPSAHEIGPCSADHRSRRLRAGLVLALVFLLLAIFVRYNARYRAANELVRFELTEAIVRDGSLALDESVRRRGLSMDSALHGGHVYLDKAPGLSLLGVPLYAAGALLGLEDAPTHQWIYALTLFLAALPSVGTAILLYRLMRALGLADGPALFATGIHAFGTISFAYGTLLFGHALATFWLVLGFALLRPFSAERVSPARAFAAGLALGLAAFTEYPVAVACVALGVYALFRLRRSALFFAAGALVLVAALLAYNWAAFGDALSFSYQFKGHSGLRALHARGFFGFTWPTAERLWELFCGPKRGLLFGAPHLALVPIGLFLFLRRGGAARWPVLFLCVGYPAFVSFFSDWEAGAGVGPRHLTPALPFFALALAMLFAPQAPAARWREIVAGVLFPGLALVSVIIQTLTVATFPYHFPEIGHPFFNFTLPLVLRGVVQDTLLSPLGVGGAWGLIPFVFLLLALGVAAWRFCEPRPKIRLWPALGALAVAVLVLSLAALGTPDPTRKDLELRVAATRLLGR